MQPDGGSADGHLVNYQSWTTTGLGVFSLISIEISWRRGLKKWAVAETTVTDAPTQQIIIFTAPAAPKLPIFSIQDVLEQQQFLV